MSCERLRGIHEARLSSAIPDIGVADLNGDRTDVNNAAAALPKGCGEHGH